MWLKFCENCFIKLKVMFFLKDNLKINIFIYVKIFCYLEISEKEFWKRPVKGKMFSGKDKNRVPSSISFMIMNKASSAVNFPTKKTWSKDGFNEWVFF